MVIRKPIVAGKFYSSRKEELIEQIEESFKSKFGPGKLPKIGKGDPITAAVVPHAGYFFSGACAAHSYLEIAKSDKPDIFILIGPNHSSMNRTSLSTDDWETPLGVAKNDKEFARTLEIPINPDAHRFEHSLEVQLPFLQYIYGGDFKFVPISVTDAEGIAEKIHRAIGSTGKNAVLVISSDMTHHGISYGYAPFVKDPEKGMKKLDMGAIDLIKNLDADGFERFLEKTRATICGAGPLKIMMEYAKLANASTVKLLNYYTSGDISGDYDTAVGYVSLVISK